MFLLTKDAKYMDVSEVALLNNVLVGVNLEGDKFFYVNPLEADGVHPFNHGSASRSPWFETACCPSNIARVIPQVSGWMYAHTDDEIYTMLYASNSTIIGLKDGNIKIKQISDYPFDGQVTLTIDPETAQSFTLKLRIPTWSRSDQFVPGELYHYADNEADQNWTVEVNGERQEVELDKGFAVLNREWKPRDKVILNIPLPVRFNVAHENVEADRNRMAITRGPLVYCAEGIDNGGKVDNFVLGDIPNPSDITTTTISDGLLKNVKAVEVSFSSGPSADNENVRLIPYYAWNNRDEGAMMVWFPVE